MWNKLVRYFIYTVCIYTVLVLSPYSLYAKNNIVTAKEAFQAMVVSMEGRESSFSTSIDAIDILLSTFVMAEELPEDILTFIDVKQEKFKHTWYTFQEVVIRTMKKQSFGLLLQRLNELASNITVKYKDSTYSIYVDSLLTHKIHLETIPTTLTPKVIIIIDDIGESTSALRMLMSLNLPLTYAVWPFASQSRKSINYLVQQKEKFLIHFPMEPIGYPKVDAGKGVLTTGMSKKEMHKRVRSVLRTVPEAIGINNHMGSKFTANKRAVESFVQSVQSIKPNLIILDSLTNPKSILYGSAKRAGMKSYRRSIFLDHARTVEATIKQLLLMEKLAKRYGTIIAIGHPAPTTIKALQVWAPKRSKKIDFIRIADVN